jgi:ABC-2 type transport system permease protein
MFARIIALTVKELLAVLRDKRSRFVLIGPPIIQLMIFGYAATFDLNDIPLAVYNEDSGAASREFISRFQGSPHFHVIATPDHDAEIAPLINERRALMVLHLGPRFSADLAGGDSASAQIILDGRNSNTAMLAHN